MWGFPWMSLVAFLLLLLIFFSLCLVFVSLMSMCLGVFLLGFILYGTLHLLDLIDHLLFHVGEIFNYNHFKNFLIPFFCSSSGTPIIQMLLGLIFSQRSLRLFSILFILFALSALQKLLPPFYLPAHWFVLLFQIFFYWFLLEYF